MKQQKLPKTWKMPRPSDEIQKEYANLCGTAGDKQYRVDLLTAEIREINKRLFELNQEHTASQSLKPSEAVEPQSAEEVMTDTKLEEASA